MKSFCVRHVSNSPITHRKSYFESLIRPSEKRLLEQGFFTFFFSVKFPSCTVPNTRHSLAVLTFKRLYSLAIGDSVISFRIFFLEVRPDYSTFLFPFEEFISIFEFVFLIEGSFFPLKIFPLRKIDDRKESFHWFSLSVTSWRGEDQGRDIVFDRASRDSGELHLQRHQIRREDQA